MTSIVTGPREVSSCTLKASGALTFGGPGLSALHEDWSSARENKTGSRWVDFKGFFGLEGSGEGAI